MDNLFLGLARSNSSSKITGIGGKPTSIGSLGGDPLSNARQEMTLPTEISAQQVITQEQKLGEVDAKLELGKRIVANQSKLLGKAVELYRINTDWAKEKMKADLQLREIQAGHQQAIAGHQLNAATTQAYTNGYIETYNVSAEIFN